MRINTRSTNSGNLDSPVSSLVGARVREVWSYDRLDPGYGIGIRIEHVEKIGDQCSVSYSGYGPGFKTCGPTTTEVKEDMTMQAVLQIIMDRHVQIMSD